MEAPKGTRTLQCPSCGLTLFEGHFSFPRCHACKTLVQSCRHCVSYDEPSGQCVEPTSAVDDVVDPDALTACPLFKQSEVAIEEEPPLFSRRFLLYAGVGCALVVVIVFLVQYVILAPLRAPAEGLDASIGMPQMLTASTPSPIDITVYNQDSARALAFRVEFPADTIGRFDVVGSTPPAVSTEEYRGGQRLAFEAIPPMDYARVSVRVRAKRMGRKDFEVRVTDDEGRLVTRHTVRKLEIEP
ncbi:MAG: hypothetical protein PVH68_02085 [Armatimonadota bacterium]|jgi:hypothetical protein